MASLSAASQCSASRQPAPWTKLIPSGTPGLGIERQTRSPTRKVPSKLSRQTRYIWPQGNSVREEKLRPSQDAASRRYFGTFFLRPILSSFPRISLALKLAWVSKRPYLFAYWKARWLMIMLGVISQLCRHSQQKPSSHRSSGTPQRLQRLSIQEHLLPPLLREFAAVSVHLCAVADAFRPFEGAAPQTAPPAYPDFRASVAGTSPLPTFFDDFRHFSKPPMAVPNRPGQPHGPPKIC